MWILEDEKAACAGHYLCKRYGVPSWDRHITGIYGRMHKEAMKWWRAEGRRNIDHVLSLLAL